MVMLMLLFSRQYHQRVQYEVVGMVGFDELVLRIIETGSTTVIVIVVILYLLKNIFNGLVNVLVVKLDKLIELEESNRRLLYDILRELRNRS